MRVIEFSREAPWIEAALGEFRAAHSAAREEGRASLSLCLAGGLTPETVYRAMAALSLRGTLVELWLGDERAVGSGDAARNGGMVERAFAGCAWEPRPRIRLWPSTETEAEAEAACSAYAAELRSSLGAEPSFDLALLGLGADGHTASVFPGSPETAPRLPGTRPAASEGEERIAYVSISPRPPFTRMTLSLALIRRARRRVFLVRGADKLPALRALEAEDPSIPASSLSGPGALALFCR
jgi:6-phosphogluconolactonase